MTQLRKKRHGEDNTRVLVIGLDGVSLELIKLWSKEGKLPTFDRILKNGTSARLRSIIPPQTPPAWASFITGKNPGKHGIFGFSGKNGSITNASQIDSITLWAILSHEGKRIAIINVPMTYPPEKINGVMISGYMAPPNEVYTYPSDLKNKIQKEIPGYKVYMNGNYPADEKDINAWLDEIYFITHRNAEATLYFMDKINWDFLMVVFSGTDWISHVLWKYMDPASTRHDPEKRKKFGNAILHYFQEIDSIIEKIDSRTDEKTILMIMSDHGNGPAHKVFFINEWLMDHNLLKLRKEGLRNIGFWLSKLRLRMDTIISFLLNHPRIFKIAEWVLNTFPIELSSVSKIDWSKTKAYVAEEGIYINLKRREPNGIVEPGEEYEKLRDYISKELSMYRDSELNKNVFERVFKREEIYYGPHLDEAPDLVLLTKRPFQLSRGTMVPQEIVNSKFNFLPTAVWSSRHEPDGLLMIIGPNIRKSESIKEVSIMDLAPTILHILGVPVASDMDGRVLKEIFERQSYLARNEIQYRIPENKERRGSGFTEAEEEEIKKRLKALGYLG